MTEFSTEYWLNQVDELKNQLVDSEQIISDRFLENPIIRHTMFADDPDPTWINQQLSYVINHFGDDAYDLLDEPTFGCPRQRELEFKNIKLKVSHNTVHHLYHIARWRESVDTGIARQSAIVEWGGGYGNMARLFSKIYPDTFYLIIDMDFMSGLQQFYLKNTLSDYQYSQNLGFCSVDSADNYLANKSVDLFVSTWALSECTKAAHEYVVDKGFYSAKHLLMAHQQKSDLFKNADSLDSLACTSGYNTKVEPFKFTGRGDQYVFA